MTYGELSALLEQTGIPWTYRQWEKPPAPPYGVYLSQEDDPFYADDLTYVYAQEVALELYSLQRDPALDDRVRAVLDGAHIPYEVGYTYIKSEALYETVFDIEV